MSRIYDNHPTNYHDEIASYYPTWERDLLEMDAVWNVLGALLDQLQDDVEQVIDNSYAHEANEYGINRLETFLGIPAQLNASLEDRKNNLSVLLTTHTSISASSVAQTIHELTQLNATVTFAPTSVEITIQRDSNKAVDIAKLEQTLSKILPAHLDFSINYQSSANSYFFGIVHMGGAVSLTQAD